MGEGDGVGDWPLMTIDNEAGGGVGERWLEGHCYNNVIFERFS